MRLAMTLFFSVWAGVCLADIVVPVSTLRSNSVIGPEDITVIEGNVNGAIADAGDILGLETRVTLYAGRPIFPNDVGPPAIVNPNQLITLVFRGQSLRIVVDGRALGRGGVGDRLRVMNLSSRSTLFGTVQNNGTVLIEN